MRNYNDNAIVKMTFDFALKVIEFSEVLRNERRFAIADQVLRSGCSIGANVKEAQGAEAEETEYWLELCNYSRNYPKPGALLDEIFSVLKVLSKIISTSRSKQRSGAIEN